MLKQQVTAGFPAPSAGRALLILAGVGGAAISSAAWLLDLSPNEVAPPVWALLNSGWTWFLLAAASNAIVLCGATRPAYRAAGWAGRAELLHSFVLLLALGFHLLSLLWLLLLATFSGIQIGYGST